MNITEIDTITKLEQNGYIGTDACLAISLFEYGLAWKEDNNQIEFIYGIGLEETEYNRFDRCTFNLDLDIKEEFDWVDFEEVASFCGQSLDQFLAMDLAFQIYNLQVHYGFENVFGSSYWEGFEIQENN